MSVVSFDLGPNLTTILIALIAAIPAILAAIYARKATGAAIAANATATQTGIKVDGRLTELLAVSKANARSEGVIAGLNGDTTIPPVTVDPAGPNGYTTTGPAAAAAATNLTPPKA